jgi:hypothetical protein
MEAPADWRRQLFRKQSSVTALQVQLLPFPLCGCGVVVARLSSKQQAGVRFAPPVLIGRWCTGNIRDSDSRELRSIRRRPTSAWCTGNISGFEPEEARSLRAAESYGSVDIGTSSCLENSRGSRRCGFNSCRFRSLVLKKRPVAQRQEQLPYKQTIGGSSPPGTTRAGVAQRKEASVLGTEQCRFESCRRYFCPRGPAWSGRLPVTQEIARSNRVGGA